MSVSGLDKIPNRTPEQAREEIAAKDRQSWFPACHGSGEYGIVSRRYGREVARCEIAIDRDAIVMMAHHFDAMRSALQDIADIGNANFSDKAIAALGELYVPFKNIGTIDAEILAGAGGMK